MVRQPDPTLSRDKLMDKVSVGLRAEQALPFIRPYIEYRRKELLNSLKIYSDNSNKDKVFETAIRLSEIETILVQLNAEVKVGQMADGRLSSGRA